MDIKYYWINIDKSKERALFMEEQFKLRNINNQRISAITPNHLDAILEDKAPFDCGSPACIYNDHNDCKFEFATTCSHLNAIKEGYKSEAPYFIVCEDDIYFPFKLNYEKMIEVLPNDFDIVQLMVLDLKGNTYLNDECFKKKGELFTKFDCTKGFFSAGMYLVSRKGAKNLLNLFTNKKTLKYDFTEVKSLKQADFLLYMYVNTYTSTYPFCFPIQLFISEIHPNHFYLHKQAIDKIIEIINESQLKNPFISDFYPLDTFINHYKALLDNKNNENKNNES